MRQKENQSEMKMTDAQTTSARILIIDDEPDIRRLLAEALGETYECTIACSAEEALGLLPTQKFELVISDVMMGGMSGLELIPHLRQLAPETIILMVSAAQNIEVTIAAMRAGAFDYLMKPFALGQLEVAVERALERYYLRAEQRRYEAHLEELVAERTVQLHAALASIEDSYRKTLQALATALETRDPEARGDGGRVVNFSLRLGQELKLNGVELRALEFGALLHDVGKIGVPDAILEKPTSLSEEEWEQMRRHPLLGQQILTGIEFLAEAARIVAEHHECWDGSGYPLGLRGEEIDLGARIFAVADAFDALTSDRLYRAGRSHEIAVAELLQGSGTQFDPRVINAFLRVPPAEWTMLREKIPLCARSLPRPQAQIAELFNAPQTRHSYLAS